MIPQSAPMTNSDGVAIIVPVYNTADYLPTLFESLTAQTFTNFEVLFVDDGSTDSSNMVLAEQRDAYSMECHVIRKTNGGQSSARNAAIDLLLGRDEEQRPKWTLFLDSDDALEPNALDELVMYANTLQVDDLMFTASIEYESDELELQFPWYKTLYRRDFLKEAHAYTGVEMLVELLDHESYIASPCLQLFRTSFLLSAGIRFEEGIIHEDNLFTAQCLLNAKRVAYIYRELYVRRIRSNSTVTKRVSWKNVDGYYTCAYRMMEDAESYEVTALPPITALINNWIRSAANIYINIPDAEQDFRKNYSQRKRAVFEATVRSQSALLKRLLSLESKLSAVEETLERTRKSTSYRVGCAITALPRRIKGFLGCIRSDA